jgi:hypothetical protein
MILDLNAHAPETGDGGQAVSALQKIMDLGRSPRDGAEHNAPVGNGFIARDMELAPEAVAFCKFHKKLLLITFLGKYQHFPY